VGPALITALFIQKTLEWGKNTRPLVMLSTCHGQTRRGRVTLNLDVGYVEARVHLFFEVDIFTLYIFAIFLQN
jgi:hypothetical protein